MESLKLRYINILNGKCNGALNIFGKLIYNLENEIFEELLTEDYSPHYIFNEIATALNSRDYAVNVIKSQPSILNNGYDFQEVLNLSEGQLEMLLRGDIEPVLGPAPIQPSVLVLANQKLNDITGKDKRERMGNGNFGRHLIQVSQKSFGQWTETEIDVGFSNKYIFSSVPVEGKEFYLFSKPFEFPFKVADLVYMSSSEDEYCFKNAPEDIEREINNINPGKSNTNLGHFLTENCSDDASTINICFVKGAECDIYVDYDSEFVEKDGDKVFFKGDALMYAAIFSEKELYECGVKRLMKKVSILASVYKDKESFVARVGCNSNLQSDLLVLINLANSLQNSDRLGQIESVAEEINDKNDANSACRLY